MIDEILNPCEEITVIINKSAGETLGQKISDSEKELGKKVKVRMVIKVYGLSRV